MIRTKDTNYILTTKVDKVKGKQLSTEDYTTAEKKKLANISSGGSGGDSYDDTALWNALDGKVTKITGKQLSTEDYTTPEKSKLSNLGDVNPIANIYIDATII